MQAWCMMREISGLIYNATEEQVVRARNQLKASILFQQDGPGGVHEAFSSQNSWQLSTTKPSGLLLPLRSLGRIMLPTCHAATAAKEGWRHCMAKRFLGLLADQNSILHVILT